MKEHDHRNHDGNQPFTLALQKSSCWATKNRAIELRMDAHSFRNSRPLAPGAALLHHALAGSLKLLWGSLRRFLLLFTRYLFFLSCCNSIISTSGRKPPGCLRCSTASRARLDNAIRTSNLQNLFVKMLSILGSAHEMNPIVPTTGASILNCKAWYYRNDLGHGKIYPNITAL